MATNRITEGVGKKIVEALKSQTDIEITPVQEEETFSTPAYESSEPVIIQAENNTLADESEAEISVQSDFPPASFTFADSQHIEDTFNATLMNYRQKESNSPAEDFELPPNVAVLKQLINKLPSGVTKQTGALIIKQTMEALGISMTGVLQEAQQVQESLNQSVRDNQTSILEYKKQIAMLESQAQKYQRQFAAVNDIISLFIQTGA